MHAARPLFLTAVLLAGLAAPAADAKPQRKTEAAPLTQTSTSPYAGYARSRLLVRPRTGVDEAELQDSVRGMGFRTRMLMQRLNVQVVELPTGVDEVAALQKLRKSGKFAYAELDVAVAPTAVTNDPGLSASWALGKLGASTAWNTADGTGVTVAVLDTGVYGDHPDLAANMVPGWNTYDDDSNSADVYGHGTMVAGVIAMVANNGIGGAGLAHGAKIMPIRITDTQGYGYYSTIAAGIYWAADHGARVVNISFSGVAGSSTIASAAQYLRNMGGEVVVAAGNTGGELTYTSYDQLLVAGASDATDLIATFSSFGSFVDVAAPGVSIYTTNREGSYSYASGTSFASPMTAATVALMMSANPTLAPADIDRLIEASSVDLGLPGIDPYFGHGRIDAAAAVAAASASMNADTVAPTVALPSGLSGAVLSGSINVDVTASDNRGVTGVELYLDGQRILDDVVAPYAFSFDTTRYADGTHVLSARAVDAAGNVGYSASVTLTFRNTVADTTAPTVALPGTLAGSTLSGTASLEVAASDDTGVTAVELYVDNQRLFITNRAPYVFPLDTTRYADGIHTVTARALDAAGNVGVSATVSVTIRNATPQTGDHTAPVIVGFNLVDGQILTGSRYRLSASASDDIGVVRMEIRADGVLLAATTRDAFAYNLSLYRWALGTHTVEVRAYDAAGNVGSASAQVVKR